MRVNDREYTVIRPLPEGKTGLSWIVTDGQKQYVLKESYGDLITPEEQTRRQKLNYHQLEKAGIRIPAWWMWIMHGTGS